MRQFGELEAVIMNRPWARDRPGPGSADSRRPDRAPVWRSSWGTAEPHLIYEPC